MAEEARQLVMWKNSLLFWKASHFFICCQGKGEKSLSSLKANLVEDFSMFCLDVLSTQKILCVHTVLLHDENFLMKMRCRWNIRKLPSKLVQLCGFFSILLTKRLFSSTFIRKLAQCGQKKLKRGCLSLLSTWANIGRFH